MVGKDEAQEGASAVNVCTVRDDSSRHWVVTTNTNTKEDTADGDPGQDAVAVPVRGCGHLEDGGDDDEDKLFSIDKLATEGITENTEHDLTNDAANIGSCLHQVLTLGRETSLREVNLGEHWCDLVNDEQVIGVEEETDTGEEDEFDLRPCEHPWLLISLSLFVVLVVFTKMVEISEHGDN